MLETKNKYQIKYVIKTIDISPYELLICNFMRGNMGSQKNPSFFLRFPFQTHHIHGVTHKYNILLV